MNPWLFAFIVSFVLFLVSVDRRRFAFNIYGGIISAFYILAYNLLAHTLELWRYNNVNMHMPDSAIFSGKVNIFFIGVAFTQGVIFLQNLPQRLGWQFFYSFMHTAFLVLFTLIMTKFGLTTFVHFKIYMATHILIFFLSLSWFKTFWLQRRKIASV